MEVRVLTETEISPASELAVGVYNYCLRQSVFPQGLTDAFLQYADAAHLEQMVREGQITCWGVWNGAQLCAMSAMQPEGHITMLYVHPMYQRCGYGKRLLTEMKKYAAAHGNLTRVTVNAMPVWTAEYFVRQGFAQMPLVGYENAGFVPMAAPGIQEVGYRKKPLSGKVIAGVVGAFVGLIVFVGASFMMYYVMIHG
jgi:GNAT superfamily N-acetyltransferase